MHQDLGFTQLQNPMTPGQGLRTGINPQTSIIWALGFLSYFFFLFFMRSAGKTHFGKESQDLGCSRTIPLKRLVVISLAQKGEGTCLAPSPREFVTGLSERGSVVMLSSDCSYNEETLS